MTGREHVLRVTIKDCKVETFRSGGPGGQNQNKRNTGVRVRHEPSGAVGESREARSQLENKRLAFRRMGESNAFRIWVLEKHRNLPPIDIDEMMDPDNLLIEYRVEGKWGTSPTE